MFGLDIEKIKEGISQVQGQSQKEQAELVKIQVAARIFCTLLQIEGGILDVTRETAGHYHAAKRISANAVSLTNILFEDMKNERAKIEGQ